MDFSRLFGTFSRRHPSTGSRPTPLTPEFRNRFLMLCRDNFSKPANFYQPTAHWETFLTEIHSQFTYLLGRPRLTENPGSDTPIKDIIAFLTSCPDTSFLDFVEFAFQVSNYQNVFPDEQVLADAVNALFLIDNLPYAVTPFVRETREELFHGRREAVQVLTAHPRVIRRDDQVLHREVIQPALTLLTDKRFSTANEEFLEALVDFRKGDYGDCLTKCGSAFESTLKLICERNGWSYRQTDTAARLLEAVIAESSLDGFFKEPLLIVATIRNRLSKAHGSGAVSKQVSPAKAKFAINATASAILLLVEECT